MPNLSNTVPPARATMACWPQYRKFSAVPNSHSLAKRIAIGVAVALLFVMCLRPEASDQQPAVSQAVRHVTLPRVVITAKRERSDQFVMTDSVQPTSTHVAQAQPGPSAAKVATRRD